MTMNDEKKIINKLRFTMKRRVNYEQKYPENYAIENNIMLYCQVQRDSEDT